MTRFGFLLVIVLMFSLNINGQSLVLRNNVPKGFECFNAKYIYIKYRQPIEGYSVRAKVKLPAEDECRCYDACSGAEILFQKGNNSYSFYNPYFRIAGLKNGKFKDGECFNVNYILPTIDYSKPINLGDTFEKLPFVFFDVDFDGKKELVMVYANQSQRQCDAYVVVAEVDDYDGELRFDFDKDIEFQIDGMSEIDFTKKSISLWHSMGISDSYKTIYFIEGGINKIVYEYYDYIMNEETGLVERFVVKMSEPEKVYVYPQNQ